LKSEIKTSNGLNREIEVEIDAATVAAAFEQIYEKYRKEAKIKGFRPGKAPLNVIKTKFREAAHDDVLQELVEDSYPKALRELELKVVSRPDFKKIELTEGNPLVYTAAVEVMPEIPNINFDGIELPQDKIEVRDSEVDAVVEYLRKKHSDLRPVDRAAEKTDIVLADLEKLDDPDNVLEGVKFEDTEIDLSSEVTVKEFTDTLPGIKAGEEREIEVSYPDDFGNQRLAGKKIKYVCRAKEIKERILPELDDAFAKTVGETETALELKLRIREDLKKQKELDHEKWRNNEVQRQFIDKNQIDVPEAMINDYLERFIEENRKNQQELDEQAVREQYRPVAANGIRWTLLSGKIAEDEKIEVLSEDTEKWVKRFADNYNMEIDKARETLVQSGRIQEIKDSILDEKIIDFLLTKVTYLPASQTDSEKPSTEEK